MTQKCRQCRQKIAANEFICPHCGAIVGDPVSYAADIRKASRKYRMGRLRWAAALIAVVLAAAVGWHLSDVFSPSVHTQLPSAAGDPVQTTAPLSAYSVSISCEEGALQGVVAWVYQSGEAIYSVPLDESGNITFILPQSDGYSIRLTGLPMPYRYHYEDVPFAFAKQEQSLQLTLENKPVPYTVKAVNTAGEPVAGACISFYPAAAETTSENQITDETGCCTFYAPYAEGLSSAWVQFVPNGYVDDSSYYTFPEGSLEVQVTLYTYEDMDIPPEQQYTVRVVDENGDPVSGHNVNVNLVTADPSSGDDPFEWYHAFGITNLDGCFTFIGIPGQQYRVRVHGEDWYESSYNFEEGSRELLIQVTRSEPDPTYNYTVVFINQLGERVPDVLIALDTPEMEAFRSDENGEISFNTTESIVALVKFHIVSLPEGYDLSRLEKTEFDFSAGSRRLYISTLIYEGDVDYTVQVEQGHGQPIPGAWVQLTGTNITLTEKTDADGWCTFRLPATECYQISVLALPEEYSGLFFLPYTAALNEQEIYLTPIIYTYWEDTYE